MRVSWAFECSPNYGLRGDRTPEKRKVGGSTPPLTTRTPFYLRKRRFRERPLAPLSAGPDAVMSVAARRPRQRDQPAAGAFPLVIGSLWSDLAVEGSHRPVLPVSVRLNGHLWGGCRPRGR